MSCLCGSGKRYLECCGKYHRGENAPDALALMRSRYTAYALGKVDYIIRTTHPSNIDAKIPLSERRKKIGAFCKNTLFLKLEILSFEPGENVAFVTFTAHLEQNKKPYLLKEKSFFEKIGDEWLYEKAIED